MPQDDLDGSGSNAAAASEQGQMTEEDGGAAAEKAQGHCATVQELLLGSFREKAQAHLSI